MDQGTAGGSFAPIDTGIALTDISCRVGSIQLASPVMPASGTAGHGAELGAFGDLGTLGAVVVKSLLPRPWEGNPPVRVHQTPAGMINSVGLQGPGIDAWRRDHLPDLIKAGAAIVVSIWGRSVDEYEEAATMVASLPPEVIAVEVNISCPNTEKGNELFAHSVDATASVIAATAATGRPRWAKLSPNAGGLLTAVAGAALKAGAEAVTVANTYFGLSVDPITRRPRLGNGAGGVSGAAIHPLAVRAVAEVHAAHPTAPIVAAGGVTGVDDVIEFALVGASAVQVGTANFADPRVCFRLTRGTQEWCAKQGVERFADLIGTADLSPVERRK
ncbi:MAG: dihydroorotate dehydrogenase [Acidimicrobiales bacterium]|nr:dihydroorotate dehydrogenase [Acidimicrobiales bacterium]